MRIYSPRNTTNSSPNIIKSSSIINGMSMSIQDSLEEAQEYDSHYTSHDDEGIHYLKNHTNRSEVIS